MSGRNQVDWGEIAFWAFMAIVVIVLIGVPTIIAALK